MFGGGCVAVVTDPGRSSGEGRARGPGARAGRRGPRQRPRLRGAGRRGQQAGGDVRGARGGGHQGGRGGPRVRGAARRPARRLAAQPRGGAGVSWTATPSEELARRVGGFVTEGDVDRQRQGASPPGSSRSSRSTARRRRSPSRTSGPWSRGDPRLHVGHAGRGRRPPGRLRRAAPRPPPRDHASPGLVVVLHRRLRELLIAADHVAAGAARRTSSRRSAAPVPGPEARGAGAALVADGARCGPRGLLELDAMVKGAVGSGSTERQVRLASRSWCASASRTAARTVAEPGDRRRAGLASRSSPERQSAEDQASSCITMSLSIAKTQRPSPRSSSSISSGSMYSWWQSSQRPPGMPKHSRSVRSEAGTSCRSG